MYSNCGTVLMEHIHFVTFRSNLKRDLQIFGLLVADGWSAYFTSPLTDLFFKLDCVKKKKGFSIFVLQTTENECELLFSLWTEGHKETRSHWKKGLYIRSVGNMDEGSPMVNRLVMRRLCQIVPPLKIGLKTELSIKWIKRPSTFILVFLWWSVENARYTGVLLHMFIVPIASWRMYSLLRRGF